MRPEIMSLLAAAQSEHARAGSRTVASQRGAKQLVRELIVRALGTVFVVGAVRIRSGVDTQTGTRSSCPVSVSLGAQPNLEHSSRAERRFVGRPSRGATKAKAGIPLQHGPQATVNRATAPAGLSARSAPQSRIASVVGASPIPTRLAKSSGTRQSTALAGPTSTARTSPSTTQSTSSKTRTDDAAASANPPQCFGDGSRDANKPGTARRADGVSNQTPGISLSRCASCLPGTHPGPGGTQSQNKRRSVSVAREAFSEARRARGACKQVEDRRWRPSIQNTDGARPDRTAMAGSCAVCDVDSAHLHVAGARSHEPPHSVDPAFVASCPGSFSNSATEYSAWEEDGDASEEPTVEVILIPGELVPLLIKF